MQTSLKIYSSASVHEDIHNVIEILDNTQNITISHFTRGMINISWTRVSQGADEGALLCATRDLTQTQSFASIVHK